MRKPVFCMCVKQRGRSAVLQHGLISAYDFHCLDSIINLVSTSDISFAAQAGLYMGHVVRKPAFCICENKDADQLRGNREADQRLCFRYTDSTIPQLHKSEISSLLPSSLTVQPILCRTWLETPKTGFLRTRLICPCWKLRKQVSS